MRIANRRTLTLASALALMIGLTGCVSKTAPGTETAEYELLVDEGIEWSLTSIDDSTQCVQLATMVGDSPRMTDVVDILSYDDVLRPEQYGYQQMASKNACTWVTSGDRVRTVYISTFAPGEYPVESSFTELTVSESPQEARPYKLQPDGAGIFASASAELEIKAVGITHYAEGNQLLTVIDESPSEAPEALQHSSLGVAQALAAQLRAI